MTTNGGGNELVIARGLHCLCVWLALTISFSFFFFAKQRKVISKWKQKKSLIAITHRALNPSPFFNYYLTLTPIKWLCRFFFAITNKNRKIARICVAHEQVHKKFYKSFFFSLQSAIKITYCSRSHFWMIHKCCVTNCIVFGWPYEIQRNRRNTCCLLVHAIVYAETAKFKFIHNVLCRLVNRNYIIVVVIV